MIEENVTIIRNVRKRNIKYMIMWVFYFSWYIIFTSWWTASPITSTIFDIKSRVLLHSITLLSSVLIIFVMKREKFKKYATIGGVSALVLTCLFVFNKLNILYFPLIIFLGISIGIIYTSMLIPLIYILNNTEKFYSILLSNLLISVLLILNELKIFNITSNLIILLLFLFISLIPILFFKQTDYEDEKNNFKADMSKSSSVVYITILINILYAVFCKGVGRAFLNIENEIFNLYNLNITFYIGCFLGCLTYLVVYHFIKKCNRTIWSITLLSFSFSVILYLVGGSGIYRQLFSIFAGVGVMMGTINVYYILGVIGKKYWNYLYVKRIILFITIFGELLGLFVGRFVTVKSDEELTIVILVISMLVMFILIHFNGKFETTYYNAAWNEDSTKAEIDNFNLRKFKKYNLSKREMEVCNKIIEGLSTRQIAAELHLSEHTVKDYRKSIFKKVNINTKEELAKRIK